MRKMPQPALKRIKDGASHKGHRMWSLATLPGQVPHARLFGVGLIVALCFIWTIILPGAVAYHNGVFYSGDIASRLTNGKTKDVPSATIEADENNKRALINGLNELNRQLGALELTKEPSSNSIKQMIDAESRHCKLLGILLLK